MVLQPFSFNFVLLRAVGCRPTARPTVPRSGTLALLMTDVPDLIWVAVVAPIGNSDHHSLSAAISMAQVVPNLLLVRKFP